MDTKEIKKVNLLEYVKSRMQSNEEYEWGVFEKNYSAALDVEIDALYRGMDVYEFNKADIIKIDGVLDPRKAGNGWIRKKPTIAKSFGRRHVYYWHFQESQHDRVYLSYYREINAYSAARVTLAVYSINDDRSEDDAMHKDRHINIDFYCKTGMNIVCEKWMG